MKCYFGSSCVKIQLPEDPKYDKDSKSKYDIKNYRQYVTIWIFLDQPFSVMLTL